MSDLKVEGKVADFCPKCKNCKSTTREWDGKEDWLTEVECEDPYDGMIKTLVADSDICCSMFTPKPDRSCGKCERFDGTYCHGPNGTITISYKALFGEPVDCPSYEEKKTRESEESRIEELIKASKRKDDLIQYYREMLKKENEAGSKIVEENVKLEDKTKRLKEANENLLEKCKVYIDEKADLKLKVDNLQSNINFQKYLKDEAYKREDKLKKELNKVKAHDEALTKHFQNDEKLIDSIQKVIFPQEEGYDYTYSYDEILNKVKELKQTISDLTETNENLTKAVKRRDKWIDDLKGDVDTLQNECLVIADIAKRAYDESIEIKEESDNE